VAKAQSILKILLLAPVVVAIAAVEVVGIAGGVLLNSNGSIVGKIDDAGKKVLEAMEN
jgi:hypothetical protein